MRFFNDDDVRMIENFIVLHFGNRMAHSNQKRSFPRLGLRNLYNIAYPVATQTALMNPNFHEFVTVSGEIVQALVEGTYEKVAKPRNWCEPHAMLYESIFSEEARQHPSSASSATMAPTTPTARFPPLSTIAVGSTEVSETSDEPGPVNSQEYAARFDELVKQYSSTKKIPVAVGFNALHMNVIRFQYAAGLLLRKSNITPLYLEDGCPGGPHMSSDEQSQTGTESGIRFGADVPAQADKTNTKNPEAIGTAATAAWHGPQPAKSDDSGVGMTFDFAW